MSRFKSLEAPRVDSAFLPTPRAAPLPLYVEPEPDEALLSWLMRLATRLGVSLHALAIDTFGINDPSGRTQWWRRPQASLLARISERTGGRLARLQRMTFERFAAVYRDDEAPLRFAGRRYDGAAPAYGSARRIAVCALCLKNDARAHLRTPWLIGWMAHCPEHGTILVERCNACGAGLRLGRFTRRASLSPATCTRCGANVLSGADAPTHPSVMRMQATLWQAKRHGIVELGGLGVMSWKEIVALIDVLIGTVYTGLTLAERDQLFHSYLAESRDDLQQGHGPFDSRHGSLRFLAWLIEGWPDSSGATVSRDLLTRWFATDRNRLCRHLRARFADPWTQGPNNFDPLIRERLRTLAAIPETGAHTVATLGVRAGSRAPAVLLRVASAASSNTLPAIEQHVVDLGRGAHRTLETDDGDPIRGKRAVKRLLLREWNLDLDAAYYSRPYIVPQRRTPPRLVYKMTFSTPAGTAPDKLLLAVRAFASEQFGFMRRYVLALHTDTPNPHVHVVVKATSEDCVRLNIKKATLRDWREAFIRHLHSQGLAEAPRGRKYKPRPEQARLQRGATRPERRPSAHSGIVNSVRTSRRQFTNLGTSSRISEH